MPLYRTLLLATLAGSALAIQPERTAVSHPTLKPHQPIVAAHSGVLLAAKSAPAQADTLGSTAALLSKGLIISFVPYIALAIYSPAVRQAFGNIISGISLAGMIETFGTYMLADTLSNFIQHPTQKMDYGLLNKMLGRPVNQKFWGTRIAHIVGVAAALAVVDHFSQGFFSAFLGEDVTFATTPKAFIAHTFAFIFTGVAVWVLIDAAFNPTISKDARWSAFMEETYATYVGTNAAWFEPFVGVVVAKLFGEAAGSSWLGGTLLPATLAYAAVKGTGWNDWGNSGLNDLEKKMNGF